jgi:hypothetical protein
MNRKARHVSQVPEEAPSHASAFEIKSSAGFARDWRDHRGQSQIMGVLGWMPTVPVLLKVPTQSMSSHAPRTASRFPLYVICDNSHACCSRN